MSPLFRGGGVPGARYTAGSALGTPDAYYNYTAVNLYNQLRTYDTITPSRAFTARAVAMYLAGHGGSANMAGGIWDASTNAVLASSTVQLVPEGSGAPGGQAWQYFPLTTRVVLLPGSSYYLGAWRQEDQAWEWSVADKTGKYYLETVSGTGPQAFASPVLCSSVSGLVCGSLGAYILGTYLGYSRLRRLGKSTHP